MTQAQVIISEDLSGVGQVSLGVALPVLAALGFNCAVLPTAVLSTHTGGLGTPAVANLAAQIAPTLSHWQRLRLSPRGLLLGYLGQAALPVWQAALPAWREVKVRVIDPAMADGGHLYAGFDDHYVAGMRNLITQATVITPNATEAALLLGEPVAAAPVTAASAQALASRLAARFGVAVIVTGIALTDGTLGVAGQSAAGPAWLNRSRRMPGHFFGTGDLFAAVVCGALMQGTSLQAAATLGASMVARAIQHTDDGRLGLNFAAGLPWLMTRLKEESLHD
ncbi:PfkB family carbohydrate kinase [Lacticaseibacillus jixianensis]|uniref:pyridoxal kinase n=1 Tax=Lacticaseibacillus jixianensis TaxID=2486012 RepID=A0ABW4B7Z4_9LACO|nr:PfkB family carbohydrate kinase [Lacticaseibacillus jixianensis]